MSKIKNVQFESVTRTTSNVASINLLTDLKAKLILDPSKLNLGKYGEQLAKTALVAKGHKIMAYNFKSPYGEIDLVSYKSGTIYLIEIKTTKPQKTIESQGSYQRTYAKWTKIQKQRLVKTFKYYFEPQIELNYQEVKILFIWFALNHQNRLKLMYTNSNVESDYD
jgi:Holliday junction resolvase-like predicted endonuclease